MKVLEQYYGPVRSDPYHDVGALRSMTATEVSYFGNQMECYIRVGVNHQALHVKQFFPKEVPAKVALRICQQQIMREVGREVFGQ